METTSECISYTRVHQIGSFAVIDSNSALYSGMSHRCSDRHWPKPYLSIIVADFDSQLLTVDPPRECIVCFQESFQFTFCDFQTKDLCSNPSLLLVLSEDDSLEVVPPLDDDLVVRFWGSCQGISISPYVVVLHDVFDIDPSSFVAGQSKVIFLVFDTAYRMTKSGIEPLWQVYLPLRCLPLLSHPLVLGVFLDIAPSIANVFFTRKSGHLENANVVAVGVWLKITEVPVDSMFTSLISHPFLELFRAFGVQIIELLDRGQHGRRIFGCSLNKCIKLLTSPHALAWRMDFNSVH